MKRFSVAVLMVLVLSQGVFAGDKLKIGIKVSPVISFASVKDKDGKDNANYSSKGSSLRFVIGPHVDYTINDNVYFCFGVWYSPRTVKISSVYKEPVFGVLDENGNLIYQTVSGTSQYNLQYLMVPLYFKFYTNEISDGMKLYFTLGGSVDFKIAEKNVGEKDEAGLKEAAVEEQQQLFSFIDGGLLLGAGVEFKLGEITTLYGGLSYNRGLTNIVNPLLKVGDYKPYQLIAVKNQLIGIDLGVKF